MAENDGFERSTIQSPDGAKIGYYKTGTGPALILVHGGLMHAGNFEKLAKYLAPHFTVYVPDRRGRGTSDGYLEGDGLFTEATDIMTLAKSAGAENIFGLSSGAIVTLQAALLDKSIKKIALYEPPIPTGDMSFQKFNMDYHQAIAKNNPGKAFLIILRGTGEPSLLTSLPMFIAAPMLNYSIKKQKNDERTEKPLLRDLIPTFKQDIIIAEASRALRSQLDATQAKILLMGGDKSRAFLTQTLNQLQTDLPGCIRLEIKGQGHLAADNSGAPERVAAELVKFFG